MDNSRRLLVGLVLLTIALVLTIVVVITSFTIEELHASSIKTGIEIIKIVSLVIIAIYTFFFIDLQRQRLSQEKFEFEIYKTFYTDAAESDAGKKLYVLENITLYRKHFIVPNSQLDNSLVALAEVILKDDDVRRNLTTPSRYRLMDEIVSDRSLVIKGAIKSKEEVFGPIKDLSDEEYQIWQENNLAFAETPFDIPLSWDAQRTIRKINVHIKSVEFFIKVFNEIEEQGLKAEINTFGGAFFPKGRESLNSHAYGIAIDLNPLTNGFGTSGTMNATVVGIFKKNGFAWGGDWDIPDPMHFELIASNVS